jgi:hypothetical protein
MKPRKAPRKFSAKTRAKMSKAHMGKKHSPETIAKIRAAKQERDTLVAMGVLKRFTHSEATKALLRKIALKQKRKHKLTLKERQKGAENRKRDRETEKRAQQILKGQL